MLKGPGRSGTEQNHIEAEFAMKGTRPPQTGLSFHGFFKIVGAAGEFRSVPQASGLLERTSGAVPQASEFSEQTSGLALQVSWFLEQTSGAVPQASGLLEQIFASATAGLGIGQVAGEPVPKIPWNFAESVHFEVKIGHRMAFF